MLILAVESSAKAVSAAITENGVLLCEAFTNTRQTHSETLMPMVAHILQITGKTAGEIDLFAAAAGPGSFTGVRIGIACVKGMAFPNKTACCPVSTLEAIAWGGIAFEGKIICAVMDARRAQVYHARFRIAQGKPIRLCPDRAVSVEELYGECVQLAEDFVLLGDGAALCAGIFAKAGGFADAVCIFPEERLRLQRASSVALAAADIAEKGMVITADALVPVYLRPSQAERELEERKKELEENA